VSDLGTRVVKRFLSTIVVIDDQPVIGADPHPVMDGTADQEERPAEPDASGESGEVGEPDSEASEDAREESPLTPPPASFEPAPVPDASVELVAPPEGTSSEEGLHQLPALDVAVSFAAAGIVCSVVTPGAESEVMKRSFAATKRADVLILDWQLVDSEPSGTTALQILLQLVKESNQRVRLVCIYTADPQVATVAGQIADALGGTVIGDYEVQVGELRMVIFAKPGNTAADPARVVSPNDLPDRVVAELVEAFEGLLSTFAISSLGAIRENTGRVLERFDSDLDAALLGHRILLPAPDDVAEHLRDSLSDDLAAVLGQDGLVAESIGVEASLARSQTLRRSEAALKILKPGRFPEGQAFDMSDSYVRTGVLKAGNTDARWTTKMFAEDDESASSADLLLASLLQTRRHLSADPPILTLGTVIEKVQGGSTDVPLGFYVCVQPACDAARVEGRRVFPLLPLNTAMDKAPSLVVRDGAETRAFVHSVKLYELKLASFMATPKDPGPVSAIFEGGQWFFRDDYDEDAPGVYRHVTRLREPLGLQLAHQLGQSASRVGLNEPEWLRRKRKP
jgi:hypothetical protein